LNFCCSVCRFYQIFQGYCFRAGARLFEYKMPFPVSSNQQILQTFEDALRREKKENPSKVIHLAVIDHIVSMPSIILPIRELVQLCRAYGVEQIFVDAAHAIGNVDVNVQEIDADYYVSNLHKWLFAPPVVAFFHCKPQHLSQLHHPLVSHNYGLGLVGESYWVGTRDYSAFLAVPAAIKFVNDTAGDIKSYRDYNHRKVVEMAQMLASAWGTHLGAPPELFGSMAMVGLPASLNIHSPEDALRMRTRLRTEFQVEVPLYYPAEGVDEIFSDHQNPTTKTSSVAYARISHQIYNKLEEYYMLRDAVQAIAAEST
jgi:selenocysteine lyase/cysteine desulfurase